MISAPSIHRSLASLLMVFALLWPSAIQLAHTLEGHDHPTCNEFKTHIHDEQLECSLCDFQVSVFDFSPESTRYLDPSIENYKSDFRNTEICYLFFSGFNSLRGPPYLV